MNHKTASVVLCMVLAVPVLASGAEPCSELLPHPALASQVHERYTDQSSSGTLGLGPARAEMDRLSRLSGHTSFRTAGVGTTCKVAKKSANGKKPVQLKVARAGAVRGSARN